MSVYYELYIDDELASSSNWNIGIINPVVEKEINTAGKLSFQITPNHPKWGSLYRMKTRVDVIVRGKNVFRGRVSEIEMDFYKTKSITCEGTLAYFCDVPRTKDPEKSKSLEAIVPDPFQINTQLISPINSNLESWKNFTAGFCERPINMIPSDSVFSGRYSTSDGQTVIADQNSVSSDEYLPFDTSMTYESYADTYYGYNPGTNFYLYSSGSERHFIGIVPSPINKLNKKVLKDLDFQDSTIDSIGYFRISAFTSYGHIFGVYSYAYYNDDDVDDDDNSNSNSFGGGQLSDYLTNWLVDAQHALVRTRVVNNANVLDVLCQDRDTPVATIEFARNMVELSIEADDFEPYSIVVASFSGYIIPAAPTGYLVEQEVPGMVSQYGKIYKILDTGIEWKDSEEQSKKDKKIRRAKSYVARYIRLFDPNIPDAFTIKALDDGVIFDNDQLAIIDVGDPVTVISAPHNISKVLLCLSMTLDICTPSNNSYKIGKYVQDDEDYKIKTLTESFNKEKEKKKK